jgi:hypothetical protein
MGRSGARTRRRESRMSLRSSAVILLCLAPCAFAQSGPPPVTEPMISAYQANIETGCRNRGRERGDPPEYVDALCSCVIRTLQEAMSKDEWQRAVGHSMAGRQEEEMRVISPHLSRVAPCRPKPPA